ncbi:ATP-binding protein [Terrimonas alba]|uniref:ATP-binding protein n=1 Tax=Terrimonas alba TaxID=3349636 RepID=UPI0035F39650
MKLTKEIEKEVRQVYLEYWDCYKNGNWKKIASFLDNNIKMIGSTEAEVYNNKKEVIKFFKDTSAEVAGKIEFRNRKIEIIPADRHAMINEHLDLYINTGKRWEFYSKIRLTSLLNKTKQGWKFIQQHGSVPDVKVQGNETIAFSKISRENEELREAVKRRTVELQQKNRDLEIETSLERVRTVAMGMKQPADMPEVCHVISQEMESLGINEMRNVQTAIIDEGRASYLNYEYFRLSKKTFITEIEYKKQKDVAAFVKKMLKGPDGFFTKTFKAAELKNWIQYQTRSGQFVDPHLYQVKSLHYYFYSIGPGALGISTYVPLNKDEISLFKRFRNVFQLAYRRFIDIQNAEAQAREAQIEAALEKVRSRSLAMHKSHELQEVVHTVFEKLNELNVELYTAIIFIFAEGSKDIVWWLENKARQQYARILVPYADNHYLKDIFEAKEKGKDFFSATYSFEEKKDLFNHLFENTDFKYVPGKQKQFLLESELATMSVALAENTGINITSYTKKKFSEQENEILKRFARVFDQAYTRFLDLQKAEAQAREAKIEAALERVRAKAMAMQNSDELSDLVAILFDELTKLELTLARCIIWIFDSDTLSARVWMANSEDKKSAESYFIKRIHHPYYDAIIDGWQNRNQKWEYDLKGDDKKSIDQLLLNETELSQLPHPVKKGILNSEHTIVSGSFNNFGLIEASGPDALSDEQMEILSRFAKVFDLTYTRFNDLKQAEANAKEAVKQAALNRIRAEIASMRSVGDLERITPLIWNELTILSIPFIRCGVFIMDDSQQIIHTFLSTPDGRAIAAFHLPYATPGNMSYILSHWHRKEIYIDHWAEAAFTDLAETLLHQGAISSREQYLKTLPPGGFYLHFLPFLQGMLYVGNTTALDEESIKLLQSVADAFSTAYARYEDFNKLEAAKQQVEKTLTDLKQAQTQLIQSEKMASLGELTAGIAHEIQNPLNFVNNFSEVSNELIDEMKEELSKGNKDDAFAIANDIQQNLEKILNHGKRADGIVKGMLQHSRTSSGQKEPTDINALCEEYLRLAFHGLRAKDKSFNAKFETEFDKSIGKINVVPQEIGRVILNLINNAFYAVSEKKKQNLDGYQPTVTVITKKSDDKVLILVKDNGNGIPQKVLDKIFQPFFTTKPTGQGTGLGLSLSYDIVKAHGGELKVNTKEGEKSEFVIQLPFD